MGRLSILPKAHHPFGLVRLTCPIDHRRRSKSTSTCEKPHSLQNFKCNEKLYWKLGNQWFERLLILFWFCSDSDLFWSIICSESEWSKWSEWSDWSVMINDLFWMIYSNQWFVLNNLNQLNDLNDLFWSMICSEWSFLINDQAVFFTKKILIRAVFLNENKNLPIYWIYN